jgi:hypothetical protein
MEIRTGQGHAPQESLEPLLVVLRQHLLAANELLCF